MTTVNPGALALQARIGLARLGVLPAVAALALLLGAAPWMAYVMNAREQAQQEQSLAQARQTLRAPPAAAGQTSNAERNLRRFNDTLGDRLATEKYLKALFAIAAQAGISLDQGTYKWQADRNSGAYRYQVLLPVKGSYGAIRGFCEDTLRALPFASLDELSFKRDSVGEDEPDASLRFTFYLKENPGTAQAAGTAR